MSEYKHPEVLVATDWVAQNLNRPGHRLVEVDVDTSSYDKGHIPGAAAWNWQPSSRTQSGATSSKRPSSNVCSASQAFRKTQRFFSMATTTTGSRPTPFGN